MSRVKSFVLPAVAALIIASALTLILLLTN